MNIGVHSSVIVAGVHANHPYHALAANWLVQNLAEHQLMAAHHSVLESYAVLTRLPGDLRVSPSEARDLLTATVQANMIIPRFDSENIWTTIETLVMSSVVGGRSYDAFILQILRSVGTGAIATFNPTNFRDLESGMVIIDLSKPNQQD
jgi:predicted nucleic acid-binding protein